VAGAGGYLKRIAARMDAGQLALVREFGQEAA
jgi:hypothetical protein